ncbi:hypothetical protein [Halocatena salina]|uniref:Uncharacterized protein n=1 Tax=Halocatena salina TaxID=2934340 RepID=A0A8U0A2U0_9EURY|nr:hypothetical protein [Halocatena salina]UPM43495.1 hypothetical protein MW046_03375 [Halocatena salina]
MGTHRASNTKPNLNSENAIVAATGLKYDEPVVTDESDFETVDGLRVESY